MLVNLTKRLFGKLARRPFRAAYVAEHVRTAIVHQIKVLREQREWNQGKFASELHKPQSVVSRLEDPDYGKLTLTTLLEIAAAFDVGLVIKYVNFPEFLRQYKDVSPNALKVESFSDSKFLIEDGEEQNSSDCPITADSIVGSGWLMPLNNVRTSRFSVAGRSETSQLGGTILYGGPHISDVEQATQNVINYNFTLFPRASATSIQNEIEQLKYALEKSERDRIALETAYSSMKEQCDYLKVRLSNKMPYADVDEYVIDEKNPVPAFIVANLNRGR